MQIFTIFILFGSVVLLLEHDKILPAMDKFMNRVFPERNVTMVNKKIDPVTMDPGINPNKTTPKLASNTKKHNHSIFFNKTKLNSVNNQRDYANDLKLLLKLLIKPSMIIFHIIIYSLYLSLCVKLIRAISKVNII